jgi:hypothetical protein
MYETSIFQVTVVAAPPKESEDQISFQVPTQYFRILTFIK